MVSEQFLTDTADYADIVLPATTQLEQFDIMFSWGHFYVSVNNPAIEPLGEAVSNVEMFRRLSERLGHEDDWYCLAARGDGHPAPTTGRRRPWRASRSSG